MGIRFLGGASGLVGEEKNFLSNVKSTVLFFYFYFVFFFVNGDRKVRARIRKFRVEINSKNGEIDSFLKVWKQVRMRIIRKVFLTKEIFSLSKAMKLKVINFHSGRVYLYLKLWLFEERSFRGVLLEVEILFAVEVCENISYIVPEFCYFFREWKLDWEWICGINFETIFQFSHLKDSKID